MRQLTHINVARGFRGGERQTELLVRALAERGLSQRVVVRRDQPLQERLSGLKDVQVVPLNKPFAAHLNAFRGGFLHAHDGRAAHVAHWAHIMLKAPYVITRRVDNRPSANWSTRHMYRQANGIAVLSGAIEQVMHDYDPTLATTRIPSASTTQQPDKTQVAHLKEQWNGKFVVGQIGALNDSHKGQSDLIKAARSLLAEDDNWLFVFVGGGKDEVALREAASDIRDHVIFTRHVDNVADYLAAFNVMAYPSIHEGLGSALLDAMATGLPVVASDVDGIPDIVTHEQQGLLTPPRNPDALADALRRIRSESGLAAHLASAGQSKAHGFTPDVMAERYMTWYRAMGAGITHGSTSAQTMHDNES